MNRELLGGLCDRTVNPARKEKYLANLRTGRRMAARGELPEFKGYAPAQKDGISVRAYLGDDELLEKRILAPVMMLALDNGMTLYPATLGTPHITIAEARYTPETPIAKQKAFENMKESLAGSKMDGFKREYITFDTIWGGGAVTLASSMQYPKIESLRRQMSSAATGLRMESVNYNNIIHTAIGRFAKEPEKAAANAFGRGLMLLQHRLVRDPVRLRIREVEIMENAQYNATHDRDFFEAVAQRHP